MSECEQNHLADRYHDGQLTPQQRQQFEAHLAQCGDCGRRLAELLRLSQTLGRIALEPILPIEQARIHRAVDQARAGVAMTAERMVMRIAVPLAALAACVLIVTSICLTRPASGATAMASATTNWQQTAVTLSAGAALPQWMVYNLGGKTP
jgi:anti-sigma factor RsiW